MPTATTTSIEQEQAWNTLALQDPQPLTAPRWRVWPFDRPAIVLGCAQRKYLEDTRTRWPADWPLLQRPSGGGAVLTGPWMVGCSVALPLTHPWVQGRLPDSYRALGQLYVEVLAEWGMDVYALPAEEVAPANARLGPTVDWACYGSLAPWEVIDRAQGRKLVGLAQRRQRGGILLVSGALVSPVDWALLCHALGQAQDEPALQRRTVDGSQLTPQAPSAAQLAARLRQALTQALQIEESTLAPTPAQC